MSVSYRNRTYNRVLGGPRYIHLTKETNAVFPGFFDPLAPAAIIYNSNTFVMNYLFPISSDFSDFASLSDPQTLPFFFKRVPPWFYLRRLVLYPTELLGHISKIFNFPPPTDSNELPLRRRLLYPFNYENKCRIYWLFSHFGYGFHFFQFILSNDDFSFLFTLTFSAVQLKSNSDLSPFCFYRV